MHRRPGFALIELCALVLVLGAVLALAFLATDRSRRLARVGEDLSRMRQIAAATGSYAADHADLIWGFSWRANVAYTTPWTDLNGPFGFDYHASAAQLSFIARTQGERAAPETPRLTNSLVQAAYSQQALGVYLDQPVPLRMFVSSADLRWLWANDPRGYDQGLYSPHNGTGLGTANWRHPYAGSFRIGLGFFDDSPVGSRISAAGIYTYNNTSAATLRQKPLSDVAFPSHKIQVNDVVARHFGKPAWHMDAQARYAALMVDGSADLRTSLETNRGNGNPNNPAGAAVLYAYSPTASDPPVTLPTSHYPGPLWTRLMLQGRDVGGPEVFP
jgi:type II secretory pathway pseudopilin PulG